MQTAITIIIILDAILVIGLYFIPLSKLSAFETTIVMVWLGLQLFCVVGFSLVCFVFYLLMVLI